MLKKFFYPILLVLMFPMFSSATVVMATGWSKFLPSLARSKTLLKATQKQ